MCRVLTYRALHVPALGILNAPLSSSALEAVVNVTVLVLVSSQVDLLLVHPHFLLIVPLYVLLGRCSVILSRAGCLYDLRTEI